MELANNNRLMNNEIAILQEKVEALENKNKQ